jgi:hypothetical protein
MSKHAGSSQASRVWAAVHPQPCCNHTPPPTMLHAKPISDQFSLFCSEEERPRYDAPSLEATQSVLYDWDSLAAARPPWLSPAHPSNHPATDPVNTQEQEPHSAPGGSCTGGAYWNPLITPQTMVPSQNHSTAGPTPSAMQAPCTCAQPCKLHVHAHNHASSMYMRTAMQAPCTCSQPCQPTLEPSLSPQCVAVNEPCLGRTSTAVTG